MFGRKTTDGLLPIFWVVATLFSFTIFYRTVELKPKVDENFFFSSNDPQFQADKNISKLFPQPPQIILSAKGDLHSENYLKKIKELTNQLLELPGVVEAQSLSRGPNSIQHAFESPLWKRTLISSDGQASFISVLVKDGDKDVSMEKLISKIEQVKSRLSSSDFELMISGAPYIVEMIRRNLLRDLKLFSVVAFIVFAGAVFVLFRSFSILTGTLVSCLNASLLTLVFSKIFKIEIGPLTSNLSVIIFVLTLSHIIFITFNWEHIFQNDKKEDSASQAVRMTFLPSFWSMVTQLLGFMSLLFVKASPLRQLGVSGFVGTLIAFGAAYLIYPSFLHFESLKPRENKNLPAKDPLTKKTAFFKKRHGKIAALLLFVTGIAALGICGLNTDPSMFSYFKKGSDLREGLEYIDKNGGSTPLKIVVADAKEETLTSPQAQEKLWHLHKALESDPSVGNVLSLPIILAEARRSPLASMMPTDWLLSILELPQFGEVGKYFITKDRKNTLFLLRMNELSRDSSRLLIVKRVEEIVKQQSLNPVLIGGVYLLQGKLSELVVSSILTGLFLLILIFTLIGGFISRSLKTMGAIFISLCTVPLFTIGIIGYLHIPFDIISSPGANIAIGIGVDAMINMLFFVKRNSGTKKTSEEIWAQACSRLWKPILCSTILICLGFGIFTLSAFPPTQRFGLSVILGSFISPLAALFVFPWIAGFEIP